MAAEFDEGDDGVQPVGGFVGLRAEGVGEAADGVQFAGEALEFGVVPEGDHGAEAGADGGGVEQDDAFGGQVDLVADRGGGGEGAGERAGQAEVGDRHAVQVAGEGEQFAGGVVAQHDPPAAVEQDQALADGVQGGLVVVVQVAELVGAHAVGVSAQPGVGEVGADAADHQGGAGDTDQGEQRGAQLVADRVQGDAGADQADDVVVPVVHGGDHAHGGAEGAGGGLGEDLPGEGLLDLAEVGLADAGGVGVGPADAVGVHDGDEGDAGVLADLFGVRLDDGAGVGPGGGLADGRRVGERQGDGGGLAADRVLVPVLGEEVRQDGAAGDHGGDDDDLHHEQLPGETAQRAAPGRVRGTAMSDSVPGPGAGARAGRT